MIAALLLAASTVYPTSYSGWEISRTGQTCMITKSFEENGMTVGITGSRGRFRAFAARSNWTIEVSFRAGLRVAGSEGYSAGAVRAYGGHGFTVPVSAKFVNDFAAGWQLDVFAVDGYPQLIGDVSLSGAGSAVPVFLRCTRGA